MSRTSRTIALAILVAGSATAANAGVMWTGSSATREADATFEVNGSMLEITLSNTSIFDTLVPIDILTGVFFDISGTSMALTPVSAKLASGSVVLFGGSDPDGVVGGEWGMTGGLIGAPSGAAYGISSSGLGLFGPANRFPGSNLQGPTSLNGLEYGITSIGDNPLTGNTPVTGTQALIQHSVVFVLSGIDGEFDLNRIGNVSFQYGTSLTEPNVPGTPAPGAAALLGLGGLLAARRRR